MSLLQGREDYGDPVAEYRALRDACGLVARVDRAVVRVEGERAAEMLNGLVTNEVTNLAGSARHALLLTAKGRVLSDLRVLPRKDDLLLDLPRTGLDNVLATFKKYLPPMYASYEDVSDRLVQLDVLGPDTDAAVGAALAVPLPEAHLELIEHEVRGVPVLLLRDRQLASDGLHLLAPAEAVGPVAEGLLAAVEGRGGRRVGSAALEVVRVESGIPRYGVDISEDNLAQETGLEDQAISHDKGCYLGQEVVARIHFRGHVNRHLRGLRFQGELPDAGTALHDADRVVGEVTSSVPSPDLGPIGLGYVRREIEPPAELRWVSSSGGEGKVQVELLPLR